MPMQPNALGAYALTFIFTIKYILALQNKYERAVFARPRISLSILIFGVKIY